MNNLAGPAKRSIGIGFMTGIGNMGGEENLTRKLRNHDG